MRLHFHSYCDPAERPSSHFHSCSSPCGLPLKIAMKGKRRIHFLVANLSLHYWWEDKTWCLCDHSLWGHYFAKHQPILSWEANMHCSLLIELIKVNRLQQRRGRLLTWPFLCLRLVNISHSLSIFPDKALYHRPSHVVFASWEVTVPNICCLVTWVQSVWQCLMLNVS